MYVASLIGFAVVFVIVAWATSVLARCCVTVIGSAAGKHGPSLERRLVEVAAFAPLLLALCVVSILMISSLLGADHCPQHHHEVHFCFMHGAPWAQQPWAVALVAAAAGLVTWRLARLVIRAVRNNRALTDLRALATYDQGVHWIASPEPVCFVTRHADIFVSRGAWDALDPQERQAMLEHERAHIIHGDVVRRFILDLAMVVGGPRMTLRAHWDSVTERLCDARAAAVTGDHESVASALVKLARLQRSSMVEMLGFTPTRDAVSPRVHAVLAELPIGDRSGRRATLAAYAVSLVLVTVLAAHASLLHDVLEAICG
jgi:Zn-dependent protease with chaperone function